jgi:hypothetical protein
MPDFPEPLETGYWDECNPLVYRKTWWIQTSTVCGTGANPYTGNVDRFAESRILNRNPIGSYKLYIETSFSYEEGRFKKRKTENSSQSQGK